MKTKILVSACLLGENCKYSGGNNKNDEVIALADSFKLIPVCPECFGGLTIPRLPSEIKGGRVYAKDGEDVTDAFVSGAEQTLYIAKETNAPCAVLKENSPSCGFGKIYDGTFSGNKINGNGITAQLLFDNEIQIFGESQIKKLRYLYE
ncbi:DUF523 domain-containing protein [Eubacterium sp.]